MLWDLATKSSLAWCVIGDFNDMMFVHEKAGGRVQSRFLLEGFKETIHDCGLMDLGFVGSIFTWEKSRGSASWVQERLDRGLVTQEWKTNFPLFEVRVIDVSTSNHLPMFLQKNKQVYVPKGRQFRFENMWIRKKE